MEAYKDNIAFLYFKMSEVKSVFATIQFHKTIRFYQSWRSEGTEIPKLNEISIIKYTASS